MFVRLDCGLWMKSAMKRTTHSGLALLIHGAKSESLSNHSLSLQLDSILF